MNNKKNIAYSLLLLLLLAVLQGCSSGSDASAQNTAASAETSENSSAGSSAADTAQLQTVRLGVMTGTVPSYVEAFEAEQGFFAENGITLEISEFAAGINTVDGVTMDELDVGYAADFAIVNRLGSAETSNLRIFSTADISLTSSRNLYANVEKVPTIQDLEGAGIITNVGTVVDYWNARIIEEAGVPADSVNIIPIDGNMEGVAAMQSGQADAMWANGETANTLEEIEGIEPIATLDDIEAYTIAVLVANDFFLEGQPETAERFLKAFTGFFEFIAADPEYAAALIADNYNVPENQILQTINELSLETGMKKENVDVFEDINRWAYENEIYSYEFDIRDYLNTDALESLYPDRVTY